MSDIQPCKHPEVCRDLFKFAKGELPVEREAAVREVVASCETCQQLLRGFQNVQSSIELFERPLTERVEFPESPFPIPRRRRREAEPERYIEEAPQAVVTRKVPAPLLRRDNSAGPQLILDDTTATEPELKGLLKVIGRERLHLAFHGLVVTVALLTLSLTIVAYNLSGGFGLHPAVATTPAMADGLETLTVPVVPGLQELPVVLPGRLGQESPVQVALFNPQQELVFTAEVQQSVVQLPMQHEGHYTLTLRPVGDNEGAPVNLKLIFEAP